ncbi:hypothetical protein FS837_006466 [Tulasnella sp. UAMH 9824]|nr:hypothetical protein FS837_006466 [Tulasnella sp. UAMH 9824]
MKPASPHNGRGFRTGRPSSTPTTPSRAFQLAANQTQRPSLASPSASTISGRHIQPNTGPAHFPTTLVQHPLVSNAQGHITQSPWSLPPLNASSAMLLTAIAMVLDETDPSPASAPHVGLYWAKNTERTKFFDYVATIIQKLCVLLDGVTDCTIVVEAVSTDDKAHQMRYHSRAISSMPSGKSLVDGISAQVVALTAQAHENSFRTDRREQYRSSRGALSLWANNGGFYPAKWADAPLPIRFSHELVPAISSLLHEGATTTPALPFLMPKTINFTLSPVIWFQPHALSSITPGCSLMSVTANLTIADDEEPVEEEDICVNEGDVEDWVPFAQYKGLKEAIEGAWCTRFDIAPEFADGIRIMLYEEHPRDWARYLKRYTRARAETVEEMVTELQSYISQMVEK